MKSFRAKPVGWQYESHRHSLAAQGVSTKRYMMAKGYMMKRARPGLVGRVHKIPIVAQKLQAGQVYPISPQEVKATVGRMKENDVKGITAIEFVQAKTGEQKGAWAQYVRGKRKLLIFSQKASKSGDTIDGISAKSVSDHMKTYVLPHEVGHHIALYKKRITDKDIETAEARADAHVIGMAADDKDVQKIRGYHASKYQDASIPMNERYYQLVSNSGTLLAEGTYNEVMKFQVVNPDTTELRWGRRDDLSWRHSSQ
jgi:hypothetical protein